MENRKGRLSRPFLGPGDNFSKSYDENRYRKVVPNRPVWRIAPDRRTAAIQIGPRSGFRRNFSNNCPQDVKMV